MIQCRAAWLVDAFVVTGFDGEKKTTTASSELWQTVERKVVIVM